MWTEGLGSPSQPVAKLAARRGLVSRNEVNPSTLEAETGGSQGIPDQSGPHMFQASEGYIRGIIFLFFKGLFILCMGVFCLQTHQKGQTPPQMVVSPHNGALLSKQVRSLFAITKSSYGG